MTQDSSSTQLEALMPSITEELQKPQHVALDLVIPPTRGRISDDILRSNVLSACSRNWPEYPWMSHSGDAWLICGGGPSIANPDVLKELRALSKWTRRRIVALNRTHEFLWKLGLPPWAGILLDPSEPVKTYMKPRKGTKYFISSQCAPATLDVFEKAEKYLWHALATGAEAEAMTWKQRIRRIAGDSTVGLRALMLGYVLGIRTFHLFGFDSSYRDQEKLWAYLRENHPELFVDGKLPIAHEKQAANILGWSLSRNAKAGSTNQMHAYAKPETKHKVSLVTVPFPTGHRQYWTNEQMARQADEFQKFLWRSFNCVATGYMEEFRIWVHGDGLLPDIANFYGMHWKRRKEIFNDVGRKLSQGRGCVPAGPAHGRTPGETGPMYC